MNQQPEKTPVAYWRVIIVIALLICLPVFVLWFDQYVHHVLVWNLHQQCMVLFSFAAVLHAVGLLAYVRLDERKSREEDKQYLDRRQKVVSQMLDHFGWAIMCLALALSEARSDWHLPREIYFALGLVGTALVVWHYIWRYKFATEPLKSLEKNSSLILAAVYAGAAVFVCWQYFTGAA